MQEINPPFPGTSTSMPTTLPASGPETLSMISHSTRSHFPQRRCSPAHSSPLPCQTEALQDPSTALASPRGAWPDLSTTLAALTNTACRGLSATASPQPQTSLSGLTAGSSRLASPRMASHSRRTGKDLYRLQELSSPPLGLGRKTKKSLQGRLLNLNRFLTCNRAKERQHRAISAIVCSQVQVATIPLLQGWSHQSRKIHIYTFFQLCRAPLQAPVPHGLPACAGGKPGSWTGPSASSLPHLRQQGKGRWDGGHA